MKIYSDKPLTSLVFLMFLSAFYPAVFFSSNNWYIFSRTQLFVLMVGAPIICAFILLVTVYTTLFITKLVIRLFKGNASSDMLNQLVNPIFAVFSILLMNFLLRNALKSLPLPRTVLILVIVTIIILIFWEKSRNRFRYPACERATTILYQRDV